MADESPVGSADFAAIARVSQSTALHKTRFASFHAEAADPLPDDWASTAYLGFRTSYALPDADHRWLRVLVSFIAIYRAGEDLSAEFPGLDPENAPTCLLDVDIELTYAVREGAELAESDVEQFASVNSTLHAWPYWREFAHSATSRLEVPLLRIGNFRVPSPYDEPDDA